MLYTLIHSPWQCDIDTLLRMLRACDDLLLLQNGVLAAVTNSSFVKIINKASATVFALKEDVEARGLVGKISSQIPVVSYTDFVNLAVKHTSQMNW